jgi:hypothetical protein
VATRTNASRRLAPLLIVGAIWWWAGPSLALADPGTGRSHSDPDSKDTTAISTTSSTITGDQGAGDQSARDQGAGDQGSNDAGTPAGHHGHGTSPTTTIPPANTPSHGPAGVSSPAGADSAPNAADPPAATAVPTDPMTFLTPFAAPTRGPAVPGALGLVAATAGHSTQPQSARDQPGPKQAEAPRAAGPSGEGFLGGSLHSAKATTRLYIPVGLLALAASVVLFQVHRARRDPQLSRAPTRPDDDGVGFRE